MKVILTKLDLIKESKHGGKYQRVYFVDAESNKKYLLDVYHNHSLSKRWVTHLKPQAIFDNVVIFKKNIIDGCCNFRYLGQRHE